MDEALQLIIEKCEKENIKTEEEFNKRISIHYTLSQIIEGYIKIIADNRNINYDKTQQIEIEFIKQIMNKIQIGKKERYMYIDNIIDKYLELEEYNIAKQLIEDLIKEFPDMKKSLYIKLSFVYLEAGKLLKSAEEPINKAISEFGEDKELLVRKIELYCDYIRGLLEDDKQQTYIQLWDIVERFIKLSKITSQEQYDKILDYDYKYYDVISLIIKELKNDKYANSKEREDFIKKAEEIIKIDTDTQELILQEKVYLHCDNNNEEEAVKLINEYIKCAPNNANVILIKSQIYSRKEEPEYEKAIDILESALKNDNIDNKYILYTSLAYLYDEFGNEEMGLQYQKLARENEDEDLPF